MEQEVEAGEADNNFNMGDCATQTNSIQNQRSEFPQQYPPSENDEGIAWPPEHEVVVFRVRSNSRHHRRDRNNQKYCTEDDCLCDGSLVLETEETFRRALSTVAEYRSRMCPKTLKNCLSDPRLGVFFTWFELGPEWGDNDDPTELASSETNNSTRNTNFTVQNRSDQTGRGLSTNGGRENGLPNDVSISLQVTNTGSLSNVSSTPPSFTGNENAAPDHNAGSAILPEASTPLHTQEPSTTYCALILKSPSSIMSQDTEPQQLRPPSPSSNAENLKTRKDADERSDTDLENSCAPFLMKTKVIQLSSRTSASMENPEILLNTLTNLPVVECGEEGLLTNPTPTKDSTALDKSNPINESMPKNEVQNAELLEENKKSSKGKVDSNLQTIEEQTDANVLKTTPITSKLSRKRIRAANNDLVSPISKVRNTPLRNNKNGHKYNECALNFTSKQSKDLTVDASTTIEPLICTMEPELEETIPIMSESTTTSAVMSPTGVVSPDSGCGISPVQIVPCIQAEKNSGNGLKEVPNPSTLARRISSETNRSSLAVASSSYVDSAQNEQAKSIKRNMPNLKRNSRPAPASIKRARAATATSNSFESPNYLEEISKIRKIVDFHTVEDDTTEAMLDDTPTINKQTFPTSQSNAKSDKHGSFESVSNESKSGAVVSCGDQSPSHIIHTITNNDKCMSKDTYEPFKLNLRSDSSKVAVEDVNIDSLDVQIISEAESEPDDSGNSEEPLMNRLNRRNRRKKKALNAAHLTKQISNRASDDDDVEFLQEVSASSAMGRNSNDVDSIANSKNAYSCKLFSTHLRKSRSNSLEDESVRESFEFSNKAGVEDDDKVKSGVSKPAVANSLESIRITFDKSKAKNVPVKTCNLNKDDEDLLTDADILTSTADDEIETDRPGWEFKGLPSPRKAHEISRGVLQNPGKPKLQENSPVSKTTSTLLMENDKSIESGSKSGHKNIQVFAPQKKTTPVSTLLPSTQNKSTSVSSLLPSAQLNTASISTLVTSPQKKTTAVSTQPTTTSKTLRNKKESFDPRTEAVKISPKPIPKVSNVVTESLQPLSSKESLPSSSAEPVARQECALHEKMSSNSSFNRKPDITKSKFQSSKTSSRGSNSNASFADGEIRMLPLPAESRNKTTSSGTSRLVSNQRQGDSCAQSSKANSTPVRTENPSISNSSNNSNAPSNKSQRGRDGVSNAGSRNETFSGNRLDFTLRGSSSSGRGQTHNREARGREGRSERPSTQQPIPSPHSVPSSSVAPRMTLSVGVDTLVTGSSHQHISPSSSDASSVRGRNSVNSSYDDSQRQKRSYSSSDSSSHVSGNGRKRKNRGKKDRSGGHWRRGLYNTPVEDFGLQSPHPPYYENEFEHPTMYSQPQQNPNNYQNMPWSHPRGRGNHYNNRVRSNNRRFNYD